MDFEEYVRSRCLDRHAEHHLHRAGGADPRARRAAGRRCAVFLRRKTVKGKAYYQIVENRRVDGHVRQRVILSLREWPNPAAAREGIPARIAELQELITKERKKQAEAERHQPWDHYHRNVSWYGPNWKCIHRYATENVERAEREVAYLSTLLKRIENLDRGAREKVHNALNAGTTAVEA